MSTDASMSAAGTLPQFVDVDIFRTFFDHSGMCVANIRTDLCIAEASREFLRQFGAARAEVAGADICDFIHPSAREKLAQRMRRLVAGERLRFVERVVMLRRSAAGVRQSAFACELTAIAVQSSAGQLDGLMVLLRPEENGADSHLMTGHKKLLTDMDARILEGVAAGASTVQLASMLYLSRAGVDYHVTGLLRKLKVNNRPALVSKAHSMGMFNEGLWPPQVLDEFVK